MHGESSQIYSFGVLTSPLSCPTFALYKNLTLRYIYIKLGKPVEAWQWYDTLRKSYQTSYKRVSLVLLLNIL
jgi:hypothetical protein